MGIWGLQNRFLNCRILDMDVPSLKPKLQAIEQEVDWLVLPNGGRHATKCPGYHEREDWTWIVRR